MKSDLVDINARLVHETGRARLFDTGDDEPVWIPKSQHEWDEETETVTLRENVAIEKGLV